MDWYVFIGPSTSTTDISLGSNVSNQKRFLASNILCLKVYQLEHVNTIKIQVAILRQLSASLDYSDLPIKSGETSA